MRAGIRGLIEIYETSFNVLFDVAIQRRGAMCQRRIVIGPYVELIKIFKQQRPLGCVQLGYFRRWLYLKLILLLQSANIFAIEWLFLDFLLFLTRICNYV